MATGDIFTLDRPLAPRLIRILYGLALILIALLVIVGVARGIAAMVPRAMPPHIAMAAPPPAPAASTPTTTPQAAPARPMMGPGRFGRGFRGGPGFRRGPGGPRFGMTRGEPVMLRGGFLIIRALVMGAIMVMVVRILAEMAGAILKMPQRTES